MSRTKVRVEEVDHEDEPDGQQRFVAMGDQDDIQQVARQKPGEQWREPHHVTGNADDHHAPEDGPIVELFPVSESVKLRLRSEPEEPAKVLQQIEEVLGPRNHRVGPPEDAAFSLNEPAVQKVRNMDKEAG